MTTEVILGSSSRYGQYQQLNVIMIKAPYCHICLKTPAVVKPLKEKLHFLTRPITKSCKSITPILRLVILYWKAYFCHRDPLLLVYEIFKCWIRIVVSSACQTRVSLNHTPQGTKNLSSDLRFDDKLLFHCHRDNYFWFRRLKDFQIAWFHFLLIDILRTTENTCNFNVIMFVNKYVLIV